MIGGKRLSLAPGQVITLSLDLDTHKGVLFNQQLCGTARLDSKENNARAAGHNARAALPRALNFNTTSGEAAAAASETNQRVLESKRGRARCAGRGTYTHTKTQINTLHDEGETTPASGFQGTTAYQPKDA